ncbi:hypothetical protein C6A85_20380, partial [Mycobacterium sp. ITM-2017-0098]
LASTVDDFLVVRPRVRPSGGVRARGCLDLGRAGHGHPAIRRESAAFRPQNSHFPVPQPRPGRRRDRTRRQHGPSFASRDAHPGR